MASDSSTLLLVGPKESGTTYLGPLIGERLGVPFLRAGPIVTPVRGHLHARGA